MKLDDTTYSDAEWDKCLEKVDEKFRGLRVFFFFKFYFNFFLNKIAEFDMVLKFSF